MMDQGYTSAQAGARPYQSAEDIRKNISPALLIPDNPQYLMYPMPGSPGLYPMPGQYPVQGYAAMPMMPQPPPAPKKSALPLVGMIMGIIALVAGLLLVMIGVILMSESVYTMGMCCMGWLAISLVDLACSILALVFSGISISGIKGKRILPTPMAKVGLIMGICGIALMIISLILIIYRILNPPEYGMMVMSAFF